MGSESSRFLEPDGWRDEVRTIQGRLANVVEVVVIVDVLLEVTKGFDTVLLVVVT